MFKLPKVNCKSVINSYLIGYSPKTIEMITLIVDKGELNSFILKSYGEAHQIRSEKALYDFTMDIKRRHLRKGPPLRKVLWDDRIELASKALGLQTVRYSKSRLSTQSRNEIRIASLFKDAPLSILRMIVVHELAHLKEKNHDKAFYKLCSHIEPDYFQLEFGAKLFLIERDLKN